MLWPFASKEKILKKYSCPQVQDWPDSQGVKTLTGTNKFHYAQNVQSYGLDYALSIYVIGSIQSKFLINSVQVFINMIFCHKANTRYLTNP